MTLSTITIVGAGITGLWQAFILARAGHRVTVLEAASPSAPFALAASHCAGGMLAPYCEEEAAPTVVRDWGVRGIALWRQHFTSLVRDTGSLVVVAPRDLGELKRFERMTRASQSVDAAGIEQLEPMLAGRFPKGLFYPGEAHVPARLALKALLAAGLQAGASVRFGQSWSAPASSRDDWLIDCRGIAARAEVRGLRGVRGEMVVLHAPDVTFTRPIRLLHPRFPLYAVPWADGQIMLGASVIERDDAGPVSLRSALDLLGSAYALAPALAEAEIIEMSAGVRPAFADNVPRIVAKGRHLSVNGMFRHGFLTAPVLAEAVARHIAEGDRPEEMFVAVDR